MKNLLERMLTPVRNSYFLYLFLLNLISNLSELFILYDNKHLCFIIFLSAFTAYVESFLLGLIKKKWLRIILLVGVVIVHNFFIVVDGFLLKTFHLIVSQQVIDIILETNVKESEEFLQMYLSPALFLGILVGICLMNLILYNLSKKIRQTRIGTFFAFGLSLAGLFTAFFAFYSYVLYREGYYIPQCTALSRAIYSYYISELRSDKIKNIIAACNNIKAEVQDNDSLYVVVVIGESYSVYHSSLYGYEKETCPLLGKRLRNGEIALFDDVVSVDDHTHSVMLSIFSLDSLETSNAAMTLYPAVFRAAGFYSAMYDNEYLIGSSKLFLTNKEVSDLLFDFRNTNYTVYDGEMVNTIKVVHSPALYTIHLWGQHAVYQKRYPGLFAHFSEKDYDSKRFTKKQRKDIADYDNATLYNDYVLNEIICKFEDKNCALVYFSDHGEEVYELSDYAGHGNSSISSDMRYQIRVPLMVWMSDKYQESNPQIVNSLFKNVHTPVITDDLPHLYMDLARVSTIYFSPYRSVINEKYSAKKPRIIKHSIDYNNYILQHSQK